MSGLTYRDLLRRAIEQLAGAGVEDARTEARPLLLAASGFSAADYIASETTLAPLGVERAFQNMIRRRMARQPVSLILGHVDFYGLSLITDTRALAPRGDSERLIDIALERTEPASQGRVIDLGTGSGCLILAFLSRRPGWTGVALDKSREALALAQENASRTDLSERVDWIEGDWEAGHAAIETADLILSNPPYIPQADIAALDPEVREHDPRLALDGGEDGMQTYDAILALLSRAMKPGARLVFEIGFDQAQALEARISGHGFAGFAVYKDFSGHNRVVEAVRG